MIMWSYILVCDEFVYRVNALLLTLLLLVNNRNVLSFVGQRTCEISRDTRVSRGTFRSRDEY